MAEGGASMEDQFENFSKFGDTKSNGTTITLSQNDMWMKQALVIDGKAITIVDTGICFNKFKRRCISFSEFLTFLDDLAKFKAVDVQEIKEKLMNCGMPGATPTTAAGAGAAVTAAATT